MSKIRRQVRGVKVIQQRLLVLKHKDLTASPIIDERINDVPEDAEDQVAVDNEEGLQAFGVVLLSLKREGGKEG